MKKILLAVAILLLAVNMLVGCGKAQAEVPVDTEPSAPITEPTTPPAVEAPPAESEGETEQEGDSLADSVNAAYAQQIERYYTAIANQWDESTYFEHEMSPLAAYYYEGNALDNIGFALMDLDGDDIEELFIGAIENAEQHPMVFEIWTLVNGEPVLLAQSGSRNRYYTQYAEEDALWSIAYEAENGAANHAVYYLQLSEGNFQVIQGILFDALANESEPWFMTYDLDWDTANDTPIDEATANAVVEAERNTYAALEYRPYSQYN